MSYDVHLSSFVRQVKQTSVCRLCCWRKQTRTHEHTHQVQFRKWWGGEQNLWSNHNFNFFFWWRNPPGNKMLVRAKMLRCFRPRTVSSIFLGPLARKDRQTTRRRFVLVRRARAYVRTSKDTGIRGKINFKSKQQKNSAIPPCWNYETNEVLLGLHWCPWDNKFWKNWTSCWARSLSGGFVEI